MSRAASEMSASVSCCAEARGICHFTWPVLVSIMIGIA